MGNYATSSITNGNGALLEAVMPNSPADRIGLTVGMRILTVDGQPLRDVLDWLWLADGDTAELELLDVSRQHSWKRTISREFGESWGIEFAAVVFDGVHTCVNTCSFCFMTMLPAGMRASLYLRDDDYRLSFLQGNFVTLTNLEDADVERIITQRLSPLHVSLHAVDPQVRELLMGKRAARGLEVLKVLLAAGINVHVQIVLVPGINDAGQLAETLTWAAVQPAVLSIGIVPYAFTRYARIQESFNAQQSIELINRLQDLAPRVQLADEWFLRAGAKLPEMLPDTGYYGSYPQYEDGIGMLRSFVDDWQDSLADRDTLASVHCSAVLVTGTAFGPLLSQLLAETAWAQNLTVLAIENDFFGPSVNVAGLLTGIDLIAQLKASPAVGPATKVLLPDVMFNDDGMTLDDYSIDDLRREAACCLYVVPCTVLSLLNMLAELSD